LGFYPCEIRWSRLRGTKRRFVMSRTAPLRFRPDGTFNVVQFTDTQDTHDPDPRTIALIHAVLDDQLPDLVLFTGDNICGGETGPKTPADVQTAINKIVAPVNDRNIPWLVTFGNHDDDSDVYTGLGRNDQLDLYRSYSNNINLLSPEGVTGVGNMNVLIFSSTDDSVPVFNVWALDSGAYHPDKIAGQSPTADSLTTYDWIKPDQISWYCTTSQRLESRYGRKVPGLMFFHIPLQEFSAMFDNSPQHAVVGERNETECPGAFNSGLFTALLERGDVRGVFVGHDHVNDYVGNYFGIYLGYSANTGFVTYGLKGKKKNSLRGARVFSLNESNPEVFETHMVLASGYGIS
jgi:Calcineurin-like phosphoesterase